MQFNSEFNLPDHLLRQKAHYAQFHRRNMCLSMVSPLLLGLTYCKFSEFLGGRPLQFCVRYYTIGLFIF